MIKLDYLWTLPGLRDDVDQFKETALALGHPQSEIETFVTGKLAEQEEERERIGRELDELSKEFHEKWRHTLQDRLKELEDDDGERTPL